MKNYAKKPSEGKLGTSFDKETIHSFSNLIVGYI